jgi:hypothetical protein
VTVLVVVGIVDVLILVGIGLLIKYRNKKEEREKEKKREPLPRIDDRELMNQLGFSDDASMRRSSGGFSSTMLPTEPEEPVGHGQEEVTSQLQELEVHQGPSITEGEIVPLDIPPGPHIQERKDPGVTENEEVQPPLEPQPEPERSENPFEDNTEPEIEENDETSKELDEIDIMLDSLMDDTNN